MDAVTAKRDNSTANNEYYMGHPHRGLAILINEAFEREGSEYDVSNLNSTLPPYGFIIVEYTDLSWYDIQENLECLHADHDFTNDDCLMVVIMTHGNEHGKLKANGTPSYTLNDICKYFTPERCPQLKGKPKLFFVNACQGSKCDTSLDAEEGAIFMAAPWLNLLKYPDLLVMYSTVPGYASIRYLESGTLFITALCKALDNHLKQPEDDILMLLTKVTHDMANNFGRQCPFFISMLKRILYLKPQRSR